MTRIIIPGEPPKRDPPVLNLDVWRRELLRQVKAHVDFEAQRRVWAIRESIRKP